ncbi:MULTISPECIES: hypothetical protein [Paenarthrobacter]|uniref:hypothetical protein n=1 Tax=Paenarthrobacter TaxID=1742992 RepID=UPI0022307D30|nr:hypothetical protein [Paenarthrobacter sp. PAE-2]MCW3767348.1 hypothetical protein [Paenarthrobacter sp. PAE-2]
MTMTQRSETTLEVDGDDAVIIQEELDAAVALASSACLSRGGGVIVTQHDYWSFTVSVSPDVPTGNTLRRQAWRAEC